jgi:hypothetical protein
VLPGKINALENFAYCNWGLTTLSSEVNVRFVALLSLFLAAHKALFVMEKRVN